MLNLQKAYPIPTHPTWNVHDSSKMKAYKQCPRAFFYRYLLGWEVDYPQLALIFGEAWHRAMAVLFEKGYSKDSIESGHEEFLRYYREYYSESTDLEHIPKDPTTALEGLLAYVSCYEDIDRFTVLHIERSGNVLITEDIAMHYRLDAIVDDPKLGIINLDHKTTSWSSPSWSDQFQLDFQMNLYTHALYSMYSPEEVWGVKVNGMLFLKSRVEPMRVPLQKSLPYMNAWLHETLYWLKMQHQDYQLLSMAKDGDNHFIAFPRRETNCVNFGRLCPYHSFCTAWENPLQKCSKLPIGFKESWWNPVDLDTKKGD